MNKKVTFKKLREFSLLFGLLFPIFFGWFIPKLSGFGFLSWTIIFGIAIIVVGLIKPNLLSIPYKLWISLGNKLGWINSQIILGIVFIVILQPIAYLMKINGYDPLRKKRFNKKTYREIRKNYSVDFTKIF